MKKSPQEIPSLYLAAELNILNGSLSELTEDVKFLLESVAQRSAGKSWPISDQVNFGVSSLLSLQTKLLTCNVSIESSLRTLESMKGD